MTTMRVVGECFFWYRLTRVFPDKFHRAVKRLCVCVYCVTYALPQSINKSQLCFRLVSFKVTDNPLKLRKKTNCTLCCFCQSQTSEKLKHPHEKACYHKAHKSIEQDFTNFLDNNVTLP